jgi:hypothetical protein
MSDPRKPSDPKAPGPCRGEAVKGRQVPGKPTREERLAKALRENLKRRKARTTKD